MKQSNKISCNNNKNCNIVQSNININGDIKCGGSLRIGGLDGDTSSNKATTAADVLNPLFNAIDAELIEWDKGISEEEWDDMRQDAEDYIFNVNHNDFHTQNLVIQKNNEIYVNGEKLPHIPKLFGWSCVINRGSRLYINGREKINGEWKLTLRAIIACLFG